MRIRDYSLACAFCCLFGAAACFGYDNAGGNGPFHFAPSYYETTSESYAAGCNDTGCCGTGAPGLIIGAEWFHWDVSQCGGTYARDLNPVWLTPQKDYSLNPSDDGFRAKLGWRFANELDVSWNYTYFSADDNGTRTANPGGSSVLIASPSYLDVASDFVSASSSIDLEIHDLEFGRWFRCDSFAFRPFGSARWATIEQNINCDYQYKNLRETTVSNQIKNSCKTTGYGVRLGGEGRYDLFAGFSIIGKGSVSVMEGSQKTSAYEMDEVQGQIVNYSQKTDKTLTGVDAKGGLAWGVGGFEISGGYEFNTFFDATTFKGQRSDLTASGFFAGASWNHRF